MTMSSSTHEMLVELPRERWGALSRLVPDSPWTTSALHAIQTRKASVLTDSPAEPGTLVVLVPAAEGDKDGHDQVYAFGSGESEALRTFVAQVSRPTEFVVDEDLVPLVTSVHPDAVAREAMCCWSDAMWTAPAQELPTTVRHLRATDADAVRALVPPWAFRTFATAKDMIVAGGCFGVEAEGRLVSVAYVADQSIKFARLGAVTAESHRRRGYALAAAARLIERISEDGRLVCALAARRNGPAMKFALKLAFQHKAMLRTYKVRPGAPPADTTSSSAQTQG
jgi:RimJ/RimL family protein N-acetyltransferase